MSQAARPPAPPRRGRGRLLPWSKGGRLKLWTLPARARDRAEIEKLSGQRAVPILVLDDGDVISGSGAILTWASEHQPGATA